MTHTPRFRAYAKAGLGVLAAPLFALALAGCGAPAQESQAPAADSPAQQEAPADGTGDATGTTDATANNAGASSTTGTANTTTSSSIITAETSPEFAIILGSQGQADSSWTDFARANDECVIQFDGYIAQVTPERDDPDEFDVVIKPGDSQNATAGGPEFLLDGIDATDVRLSPDQFKALIKQGTNVTVTAELDDFNQTTNTFELDEVTISER